MISPAPAPGDYMHGYQPEWSLDRGKAALLVVDMQYASGSRLHGLGRLRQASERGSYLDYRFTRIENLVVPAIQKLLAHARQCGLPVIYLVLGAARDDYSDMAPHLRSFTEAVGNRVGSEAYQILREVAPLPDELVLRKTTVGAFSSTGLADALTGLGVTDLVICGISTSYCVDQTAREAAERGFRTVIIEDAVAENEAAWHEHSLYLFGRSFGRVAGSAAIVAELSD